MSRPAATPSGMRRRASTLRVDDEGQDELTLAGALAD
jgi:hypothetical protein